MQPLSLAVLSQGAPTNEKCLLTQTGCKMQEGLLLTLSCVGLALAELSPDGCWPQTYNWQGVRSGEPVVVLVSWTVGWEKSQLRRHGKRASELWYNFGKSGDTGELPPPCLEWQ